MQFSTIFAVLASFAVAAQASPVELEERRLAAKLTLCEKPNMQDCDTTYVPVNTCYYVNPCKVESLNTAGRVCDFYSEPGCGGKKTKVYGTKGSQPLNIELQSVYCW